MAMHKDFPKTMVMSGYDRHRQNGKGSVVPEGTIVKQSHWGWAVATLVLVGIVALMPLWLPHFLNS